MRERGMVFSAPEVRALLDGTKTQARRVVGGAPIPKGAHSPEQRSSLWTWMIGDGPAAYAVGDRACPYGAPGDALWGRETWAPVLDYVDARHSDELVASVAYRATYGGSHGLGFGWRSSTQMPRWASRISLEITDVRVERLQDISEDDARAEGVACDDYITPRAEFAELWDSVTQRAPWASNPWVWALTFKRIEDAR